MKYCFMVISTYVLLMIGCVTITPDLELSNPVEKVYRGEVSLGTKNIPLPEGEWKVIASGEINDFFKIYLLKEHENKKFSYIRITVDTPMLHRDSGYAPSEYFNRDNLHHKVVNSNQDGEVQDAWAINHTLVHFNPEPHKPIMNKAAEYIRSNGYIISSPMIKVSHRMTGAHNKRRYLVVSYFYNPEAYGIAPVEHTTWKYSDWHMMRVNHFPEKVEFIEMMKVEGAKMHERIKQGLGRYY
ncbi:MAG: hypothetical protein GY705_15315 [Bacteroidetes bacterium]|nr:hypothetical protein [Bacteroidota bacterium]